MGDNIEKEFNNGSKPRVMVDLALDDPMRGDAKAVIGVGQRVAEMLDAEYVYVDNNALEGGPFPSITEYRAALVAHAEEHGYPDILVDLNTFNLKPTAQRKGKQRTFEAGNVAEAMSTSKGLLMQDLVPHDLTPEIFEREGQEFERHYPEIKGDLVAVMMGGETDFSDDIAEQLASMAAMHDEVTFFVCPSRRTGEDYERFMASLQARIKGMDLDDRVHVIGQSYQEALEGYNPYAGLLAKSDHVVLHGDSHSIVSEALATGKGIVLHKPTAHGNRLEGDYYDDLSKGGYVFYLTELMPFERLPTVQKQPLNVTEETARNVVANFREWHADPNAYDARVLTEGDEPEDGLRDDWRDDGEAPEGFHSDWEHEDGDEPDGFGTEWGDDHDLSF